jgi:UDP-GlcNAc3NAcA epimerase
VETVDHGWNVLVDLDADAARAAVERAGDVPSERPSLYGDGHAGERVVAALEHIRLAPRLRRG